MTESALDHFTTQFNRLHKITDDQPVALVCDFCSGPIEAGDRVATYVSNGELGGYARPYPGTNLYAHRTYCEECNRQHIVYPNKGTGELLLAATIQEDGTHADWSLRESSSVDHGEPWDGKRAFEFVFGDIFEGLAANAAVLEWTVGHEDVVDLIRLAGVDLREVFDENGTIIAPEAKQERIQQQVLDHLTGAGLENHDDAYDQLVGKGRPGAFTCPECSTQAAYWAGVDHAPTCSSASQADE
jgi:hypothetical protein